MKSQPFVGVLSSLDETFEFVPLRISLLFGLALLGTCFLGACSGSQATLHSRSSAQSPVIDGSLGEWKGALTQIDDRPISMNVFPSDRLLYVVFSIRDQELLRALAEKGLTVWVDPRGKRRHAYGVRYPIGLQAQRAQMEPEGSNSRNEPGPSTIEQVFPSDLAVLRNDTVRHRVPPQFSTGLRVAASLNPGSLTYEVAIPFNRTSSDTASGKQWLGIHTSLSRPLSVGLEIPESDDSDLLDKSSAPSITGREGRPRSRRRQPRRRTASMSSDQESELRSLVLWRRVVWAQE